MRRAAALVTATVALAAAASTAQAHGTRAERSVEASINAARAQHGCGPLRVHRGLSRVAGSQARLLLAGGRLDHDAGTPLGERLHRAAPSMRLLGEDLAWSPGRHTAPGAIVRAWMHSPVHREILLDCRFSRIGIGIAGGHFGRHGHATVYTADLAA
jgi:uncharacterized protein YkwD